MSVRSALRVLDLLEWWAGRHGDCGLAEISAALDLPKSSTLLLLRTLVERGYLLREPTGRYRLLRLPGEATEGDPAWGNVLRLATPLLSKAVATVGESGFVAVPTDRMQVRYLCKLLPPSREMKYDRDISVDRTAHHVASGLALLSALPDAELDRYLAALPPGPDRADGVRAAVELARRDGVATNLRGRIEGAAGVAAPVLAGNRPLAAINLAGPADRVRANLPALQDAVRDVARQLGRDLARRTPVSGAGQELAA